jgi:glycosyltransferase involved in cell wall biosynthesis
MRILHVINALDTGGAQVLLEGLSVTRHAGDEMHLLVLQGEDALSERLEATFDSVTYLQRTAADRDPLRAVISLGRMARRLRPDIVHSHLFQSDLISLLTPVGRASRVSSLHLSAPLPSEPRISEVVARSVALASKRFDAVIATDESCLDYAVRLGYRRKPVVIHNGVLIPNSRLPYDASSTKLVSLARFHPMKAHDVLFAAVARVKHTVPAVTLVCAGSGTEPDNPRLLEALARSGLVAGLDVELLGPVSDIEPVLSGAACLVLASRYGETFPLVGSEATARGIPVITTDVGGSRAFASAPEHVVAPGSSDQLAAALVDLLTAAPDMRMHWSEESRARAAGEFSVATASIEYRKVYLSCLAQSRRRAGAAPS